MHELRTVRNGLNDTVGAELKSNNTHIKFESNRSKIKDVPNLIRMLLNAQNYVIPHTDLLYSIYYHP